MSTFPESVLRALVSTCDWLKEQEPWVAKGSVQPLAEHILELAVKISKAHEGSEYPKQARRTIIEIISYLPPDVRMSFLLSLARDHGDVLDRIFCEKYDTRSEPSRYNTYTTIGSFARRTLLMDIFSEERMERVEAILRKKAEKNA